MSRRSGLRAATFAVALAAVVVVTASGCSAPDPTAPEPAPTTAPVSDPVAWVDGLCAAALAFAAPATRSPDLAAAPDLPAVKLAFGEYLAAVVTGAQQGRVGLDTVGAAPEPGGTDVVARMSSTLAGLEQTFGSARTILDAADPADPAAFVAALTRVETALTGIVAPDPLADIAGSPPLVEAAAGAARCGELTALEAA